MEIENIAKLIAALNEIRDTADSCINEGGKNCLDEMYYISRTAHAAIPLLFRRDAVAPIAASSESCQENFKEGADHNVDEQVKEIVCDHLCVLPEQCTPQAHIVNDLGADDLDPVELCMDLEVKFGVCFTDDDVSGLTTYEKLLNLVKEKLAEKERLTKVSENEA